MVVLAASMVSKTGKVLVSRQFVDMPRIRIEGLLAAFPKLVGTGKQHTYVQTENVRYVYQPMESVYLLLVTNKQSNILEDLETLRLLSKLVPEYCPGMEEETVSQMAFELIFAFDEVISLGFRDNVTVAQVKQYCEMDSVAERQYKADIQSKINETKDLMKKKATEIDRTKADRNKSERGGMSSISSLSSGPISLNNGGFGDLPGPPAASGFGSGSGGFGSNSSAITDSSKARGGSLAAPSRGMGMKLGKVQKANQFLESLKAEGDVIAEDAPVISTSAGPMAAVPITDPITVSVEEKLVALVKRDGGLENLEIQGTMALTVLKEEDAYIQVHIEGGADKSFQFKTHPNIDKGLYNNSNVLGLKDPSRPFPTGSPLGILKWRMSSRDEALLPITINCWPSVSGGETYVNIEYEASEAFDLQNVLVTIPLPALRDSPTLKDYDGEPRYDSRRSVMEWSIVYVDNTNRNGSMEFVVPAANPDSFFPIDVKFSSVKTFCDVKVAQVVASDGGASLKFGGRTQLFVENYQVV